MREKQRCKYCPEEFFFERDKVMHEVYHHPYDFWIMVAEEHFKQVEEHRIEVFKALEMAVKAKLDTVIEAKS